jgi:hypothetical protein
MSVLPRLMYLFMDHLTTYSILHYTYLLHGAEVLLEKLIVLQLLKKFSAFYGTRRFITAFASARHLSLSSASSIQSIPPSYFLKIHLNIILPSTPVSPNLHYVASNIRIVSEY